MNMPGRKYFEDESIYSDWFRRGGDDMLLRVELIDWIDVSSAITLTIQIFTKNTETTGNGAAVTGGGSWDKTRRCG
jgi:hypothetical protein